MNKTIIWQRHNNFSIGIYFKTWWRFGFSFRIYYGILVHIELGPLYVEFCHYTKKRRDFLTRVLYDTQEPL